MPAGFNGLAGVCAAFWAGSSFFLAMDSVATPMAFMRKCAAARSGHAQTKQLSRAHLTLIW
jgi:hypothetical protein